MYKIGEIYIWQNQTGRYAVLNGKETTVVAGPFEPDEENDRIWWETDTLPPGETDLEEWFMTAYLGCLRPKDPPSGERLILEMFNNQSRPVEIPELVVA